MSYDQEVTTVSIEELKPYQNRFNVSFKVIEKSEVRETSPRDDSAESHRLCDIKVADKTGSIILTAWDNDIQLLEVDNFYELANGYVNIFHDSMRLSRGKFGTINKIENNFEVNLGNDRSSETHEGRQRRGPSRNSYNNRRSFDNGDDGNYRPRRNNRFSFDNKDRW